MIIGETLEEVKQVVNISLETILQGIELINSRTTKQISLVTRLDSAMTSSGSDSIDLLTTIEHYLKVS